MQIAYFANKVATAMRDIGSSHVFFILQQAFDDDYQGDINWIDVEKLLSEIIENSSKY